LRAATTSTIASIPSSEASTSAFTTRSDGTLLTKQPRPGRISTRLIPTIACSASRMTVRLTSSIRTSSGTEGSWLRMEISRRESSEQGLFDVLGESLSLRTGLERHQHR